ncbi:hypothetical protein QJS10_CPB21g00692 [Acorus calamus]|uniref:Uncharacterized protein n=1 Tax=Acorus calamus TaxID=4465 RepID=A0AAV9C7C6_ACOCL|nr:hypothetical protein QJS10_CPB21g00692 [Acorus calamus]
MHIQTAPYSNGVQLLAALTFSFQQTVGMGQRLISRQIAIDPEEDGVHRSNVCQVSFH